MPVSRTGGEQAVSVSNIQSFKMLNMVSPSGNLISLDPPQGRGTLAGTALIDCDIVFIEQDPGSLPSLG